ncbi:head-tail joining protein [Pseudodesulfovibrio pelocollis]|uniref:head-tail joining protein n=1 Tax=Pseudodesulfovibrio pelocollis TaxID=3051432 RepID=UPI00255B3264|nr:hypothetical protein [Pseudodesulfovibrio sp. SB368]
MTLHHTIDRDVLSDLFFRDFGRAVVIDGVTLCVVEREEGAGLDGDGRGGGREGVEIRVWTLFWREADLPAPKVRQRMTVDGQEREVARVESSRGILEVQMWREVC